MIKVININGKKREKKNSMFKNKTKSINLFG